MKKIDLICYDFDGTLCNTLPDIADSMNVIFKRHGLSEISEERVRDFIGSGIGKLVERSVYHVLSGSIHPLDSDGIKQVGEEMAVYYSRHLTDRSHLYDGSIEILEHFSHVPQIIVSNKPEKMVRDMLMQYGIDSYFDLIVGGDTLAVCKPDPAVWDHIVKSIKLPDERFAIMVGDSIPDVIFGKNTGMLTIAVSYGYNDVPVLKKAGADHIIDSLYELKNLI
jgi:phosphoglycolate phosphatase